MKKYTEFLVIILLFAPAHAIITSNFPPEMPAICHGFEKFLGTIDYCDCKPLNGGLSNNTQYQCVVNDNKYVVRILKESLFQRKNEIATHLEAMRRNIAPHIHYHHSYDQFSVIIMDFIDGHTLTVDQGRTKKVLDQIALNIRTIKQFNPAILADQTPKNIWNEIVKNYEHVKNKYPKTLAPLFDQAIQKIELIHQRLMRSDRPFTFNHNDLNPRNMFFSQGKVLCIDWENATMNHDFYDLASYSVFLCLRPTEDNYLLMHYLQKKPSDQDIQQFKDLKLMVKAYDTFLLLTFLTPLSNTVSLDAIKTFEEYEKTFSQNSHENSPEFLYQLAISQLKELLKKDE